MKIQPRPASVHRRSSPLRGSPCLRPTGSVDPAVAKSSRDAKRDEFGQTRGPGTPMLAIVALSEQRVTIYDAEGKMLQSPVSTGATGLETPAGIYSVVQKNEVHQSNVYEDGNMPFMQRITWTGIALHAGVLPGQPASHGCVRMPLRLRPAPLRPDGHRPARDRRARRHRPRRHRPPRSLQAEPGAPGAGTGHAAAEPHAGSDRGPAIRLGAPTLASMFRRRRARRGTCRS